MVDMNDVVVTALTGDPNDLKITTTLINALHKNILRVTFTKVDGTERVMLCTLREDVLPAQVDLEETIQKRKPNPNVLSVWDIENKGWRSFRKDSVITFQAVV